MAEEKQHPFQNFDSSKMGTMVPRGTSSAPATDTVVDDLEDTPASPDKPVDQPGAQPKQQEAPKEEVTPGATPNTEATPETPETPDQPGAYTQEDFNADVETFLGETTQGKITKPEQITAILAENASLKTQLQNKELEFPSERAKKLYEFAVKNDGNELAAAGQYLRVQSLDLAKLSPKEKQFEGFVLARPDLTREEAKEIFDERYTREFADIETDVVKRDEHKVRTMEAEKRILAMQDEFKKVPERTASAPEQVSAADIEKITADVDQSLSDFGGLVMQFGDSPDEQVKIPMSAGDVSDFRATLIDPNKFIHRIMESSMVDGKFSKEAYRDTMFRLWNLDKIITETRANGITVGQLGIIKERKNAVAPKGTTGTTAPTKGTYAQALGNAVKAANQH